MSAEHYAGEGPRASRGEGPKISRGEQLLYGDFAEVVRRVGIATVELHEAMIRLGASIEECQKVGQMAQSTDVPMDPFEDTVRTAFARLAPIHDSLIDEQAHLVATAVNVTARSRSLPDPETGRFTFPDASSDDPVPGQIYGNPSSVSARVTSSSPGWTEVPKTGTTTTEPPQYPEGVVPGEQGFPSKVLPTETALIEALDAMRFWQDRGAVGWQVACGQLAELALRRILADGRAGGSIEQLVVMEAVGYDPNEWMVIRPAGAGG